MREIRLSGSEGGVARQRHPYPYRKLVADRESVFSMGRARATRAVFGALAEHTVRSAGRRPVLPRRLRSPR
jgi:hypothetical protein